MPDLNIKELTEQLGEATAGRPRSTTGSPRSPRIWNTLELNLAGERAGKAKPAGGPSPSCAPSSSDSGRSRLSPGGPALPVTDPAPVPGNRSRLAREAGVDSPSLARATRWRVAGRGWAASTSRSASASSSAASGRQIKQRRLGGGERALPTA